MSLCEQDIQINVNKNMHKNDTSLKRSQGRLLANSHLCLMTFKPYLSLATILTMTLPFKFVKYYHHMLILYLKKRGIADYISNTPAFYSVHVCLTLLCVNYCLPSLTCVPPHESCFTRALAAGASTRTFVPRIRHCKIGAQEQLSLSHKC